jgi:phosphate transport system substrate-binding protein
MIRTGIAVVALLIALCLTTAAGAETLTAAGSGGMIPLMTMLADAYMKKYPADTINVRKTSITQSGGVLAALSGAVDIGMSARHVAQHEVDASVAAYHIADVAATVAVHSNVRVTNLSSQQLCAIYAGKITNWQEVGGHNAPITVLTRPESDSTKMALRDGIDCFKGLKETGTALNMFKSNDMRTTLQQVADTIGIIDVIALEQAGGKARAVKLDNRSPSAGEIAANRWPIVKHYTLVVNTTRKKSVDRFMRFIKSREGAAIISRHNGVPINFTYP